MKVIVKTILILAFSFFLVFSAWKIYDIRHDYKVGEDTYENLQQYVSVPDSSIAKPTHEPVPGSNGTSEEYFDVSWPQVDFEQLLQINPDVVGLSLIHI